MTDEFQTKAKAALNEFRQTMAWVKRLNQEKNELNSQSLAKANEASLIKERAEEVLNETVEALTPLLEERYLGSKWLLRGSAGLWRVNEVKVFYKSWKRTYYGSKKLTDEEKHLEETKGIRCRLSLRRVTKSGEIDVNRKPRSVVFAPLLGFTNVLEQEVK